MHVSIERLYRFVVGAINLTVREQCHLARCSFCVMWLDALRPTKSSFPAHQKGYRDTRI
jgi:hypothetical protein